MNFIGQRCAKLHPRSLRPELGSGGTPDFTPQDIAAAIASISDPFDAMVFNHFYQTGMVKTSDVEALMLTVASAELVKRANEFERAKCAFELSKVSGGGNKRLEIEADKLRYRMFPKKIRSLSKLVVITLADCLGKKLTGSEKAKHCGVSLSTYNARYAEAAQWILNVYNDALFRANSIVKSQLK